MDKMKTEYTHAKHTKGPWHVTEGDEWTSDIHTNTPEQGIWTVASANKRRDEFEANKMLIAAAPDMLEALQQIVARCNTLMEAYPEDAGMFHCMADESRAAIHKATGGNTPCS